MTLAALLLAADDPEPVDELRTDTSLEAGPWWLSAALVVGGVAVFVAGRRLGGSTPSRLTSAAVTYVAALLAALGLIGILLAAIGPVELG